MPNPNRMKWLRNTERNLPEKWVDANMHHDVLAYNSCNGPIKLAVWEVVSMREVWTYFTFIPRPNAPRSEPPILNLK